MDLSRRFDLWWARLPRSPRDRGRVVDLVLRPPGYTQGARRLVEQVRLDPERGAIGDKWETDPDRDEGAQVALINVHVIRSLARGHADASLSGDTLHVDLDLSEANLPPGTRLEVGQALLVVSAVPHRPCASFARRFGAGGAKRVARADRRGLRGRGVMCVVERGGVVRLGDAVVARRSDPN
ncbi:MOSC domain-containing protein [Engelhardtia mirabilis]|uniref:MOSC domain-containing protein n=1 Tax=Engelhardtia mirabilis TaxID=2528011 RepID=A0A518BQZ7_9BACT|nr:hypothetical protein Pla133_45220 [Planctomycetes bacterium Pla133]QDV03729.1 hypothetical protein Pla86_45200 [Planctomycetes bacterium Pla86]